MGIPRERRILSAAGTGGLATGVLSCLLGVLGSAGTASARILPGPVTVRLQRVATTNLGIEGAPTDLVSADDNTGRSFVTTRNGVIRILSAGALSPTPFLDMTAAGVSIYPYSEGGLLGLAFSPTYAAPSRTPGSG